MPDNPGSTRLVATHVPISTAQRLKQLAAITDKTMAQLHTEAIEEYLARQPIKLASQLSAS